MKRYYEIDTNLITSKKRKQHMTSDLTKYLVKSPREEVKAAGREVGEQGTKEPPLEELGLVKTHQDQEVRRSRF